VARAIEADVMRRAGLLCLVLAGLCLALGLAWPGNAGADGSGKVLLSVDGAAFSAHPDGALVDIAGLSPGESVSGRLGVRSGFGVGVRLSVGLIDVHDDDNGCTTAEARVDATCGARQGELADRLVMTISSAAQATGRHRVVWTGSAKQLEHAVTLDGVLPAGGERWLSVTAALPAAVGNIVQSDTLTFGVRVVLAGNGVRGGSAVDGTHTGIDAAATGDQPAGHGVDALATTGFATVLFLVGALALIGGGCLLAVAGRARRRVT
jgi:hypothetical protein